MSEHSKTEVHKRKENSYQFEFVKTICTGARSNKNKKQQTQNNFFNRN